MNHEEQHDPETPRHGWQDAKAAAAAAIALLNVPDDLHGWTAQVVDATDATGRKISQACARMLRTRGAKVFYVPPLPDGRDAGPIVAITKDLK